LNRESWNACAILSITKQPLIVIRKSIRASGMQEAWNIRVRIAPYLASASELDEQGFDKVSFSDLIAATRWSRAMDE